MCGKDMWLLAHSHHGKMKVSDYALSRRHKNQMALKTEWKSTACVERATSELWKQELLQSLISSFIFDP